MNVFLPYPDYAQSVKVLDNQRLNKQIIEAAQLIKAIKTGGAWSNHPAARMFKDSLLDLCLYGALAGLEAKSRGMNPSLNCLEVFKDNSSKGTNNSPTWLGKKKVHAGYRSNLLRKGRADAVCAQIKRHLKLRSINAWLKENHFPEKSALTSLHINELQGGCRQMNTPRPANYYKQFGWKEDDTLPYFWPV